MKTYLDCLPCLISQALKVARVATNNEKVHRQILDIVMERLIKVSLETSPPEISQIVYSAIKKITNINDPYYKEKLAQNKLAMELYPDLKERIRESNDPLFLSARLAIAGNIIDLGVNNKIDDTKEEIISAINASLTINHFSHFKKNLQRCKTLLYLGDNAGEIVFDKIFIEEIKKIKEIKVFFVVRGAPIINDATLDDARSVEMERVAEVISNGFDAPGTILSKSSPIVSKLFSAADMIVSKGQGNYETLNRKDKNIFFLLKTKCQIVARDLGVSEGDAIFKSQLLPAS